MFYHQPSSLGKTYLGFQITMHDPMRPHELQRSKHLDREPPHKRRGESAKVVGLDQLVQIDAEQLGDDTQMTSEIKVIRHSDHIMLVLWILSVSYIPTADIPIPEAAQGF